MNRLLLTLVCFACTLGLYAQIPTGYYDSANGLTGYALKTQLKKIIDDVDDADITANEYFHVDQGYDSFDAFTITADLDTYYENDNSLLDIYSENPTGTDPYNYSPTNPNDACGNYSGEGDCWNKEHVIPQSVFSQNAPMRGDAHHLLPTDGRVNGFRSNYPYGHVNTSALISQSGISNPTQNGSKLGANLNSGYSAGYSGTVFEPIDEFKGDIARIYFYFVTRYQDQVSNWSSYAMFNGTADQALDDTFLSILLEWNSMDPVSQKEIDRNNAVYAYQGNRNPFIDHPEYIDEIWNSTPAEDDTEAPTTPTNLVATSVGTMLVQITWNASTDNVGVTSYNIYSNGTLIGTATSTTFTTGTLPPLTGYCFIITAVDAAGNESDQSIPTCITTPEYNNASTELFFSEYMEGSGSNKALEIANFTGSAVSLSNYSLKLSANGNSGWTATYSFPTNASIAANDVYVIANGGLTSPCSNAADDLNNTITGFNGNDAVGLFKNDVLIDLIGEVGNSDNFAQNVTLIRKSNIYAPNTVFTPSEWDTYAQDTCSNLGSHSIILLGKDTFKNQPITLYPNPVTNGQLFVKTDGSLLVQSIQVYTLTGQQLLVAPTTGNNQWNVSSVKPGMYLLHIITTNGNYTEKLIIK